MKKIIFFSVLILLAFFASYLVINRPKLIDESRETTTENIPSIPSKSNWPPTNSKSIEYNNQTYRIYYYPVTNPTLIPNYQNEDLARSLVEQNDCKAAVNGGFYEEDGSPLGLVTIDGKQLNPEVPNSNLITGFVWIDSNNTIHIGQDYNETAPTILQTGPFIESQSPLSLVSDKQARRSAIVESTDGTHYIVAVTFDDLTTSGPFLKDLPPILFSDQAPFRAENAINLDGGTASYFYIDSDIELSELTSIGSLFCIQ